MVVDEKYSASCVLSVSAVYPVVFAVHCIVLFLVLAAWLVTDPENGIHSETVSGFTASDTTERAAGHGGRDETHASRAAATGADL